MKKIETIKDWINYKPLSFKEKFIMSIPRCKFTFPWHINEKKFNNIQKKFFNLIKPHTINNNTNVISFDTCATNLINKLFKHYVNSNTLVISTKDEHPSVKKNLEKTKNKYLLLNSTNINNMYEDIQNLEEILQTQKFSNIFIYIIGTRVNNGISTPEDVYKIIKKISEQYNKNVIMIIDAAQELFLCNRDYQQFDYIIFTGHAYIKKYNLGVLISKKGLPEFGNKNCKWGSDYLKRLKILFKRKDKLFMFNKVLAKFFNSDDNLSVKYLYHIYVNYSFTKKQEQKSRNYCRLHLDNGALRMRAIYYILWPHMLIRLKKYIPFLLKKITNN